MNKTAVGVGLLASAFAPLVALVSLVRIRELGIVGWVILAACLLAVLFLLLVLRSVKGIQDRTIETKTVRKVDERVLAFTSSYVVPVIVAAFAHDNVPTLVASAGLVLLLAVIYVRAGLYHLNPTLAILGYRLYEVTASNETVTMLLTRARHIPQSQHLACHYLNDDVAIQMGDPT